MGKFQEYLNSRKVIAEPIISNTGDEIDVPKTKAKEDPSNKNKTPAKHPQLKEEKSLAGEPKISDNGDVNFKIPSTPENGGNPYIAPSVGKKTPKANSGLGDLGDTPAGIPEKGFVTDKDKNPYVPGGTFPTNVWFDKKETKTEQFINKTKNLSLKEYIEHVLNLNSIKNLSECECDEKNSGETSGIEELPMITAYAPGKFHPNPIEAIDFISGLSHRNPRILENLIHRLKNKNLLPKVIETLVESHPEFFEELVKILDGDKGSDHAGSLVRAMNNHYEKYHDDLYDESVSPPFSDEAEDESEPMSGHSTSNASENMPEEGEEDENPVGDNEPNDEEKPQEKPKKLKHKFAHDNVLSSMSKYDHIREKMKSYMNGY